MPDSAPTAVDARLGGVGHGVTLSGVEAIDSPASSVAVSVSPAAPPPLPCVLPHVSSGGAAETPLLPGDAKKAEAREYTADEQHLTLHDLAARYATRVDEASPSKSLGLTSAEAAALLAQHGPNRLTPPKGVPEWYKFVICFTDPFMVALLVAGGFCFVAYGVGNLNDRTNAILGGVLWGLVFATCTLTYIQGRQTSAVMSSFTKMLPSQCTIVRDGRESRGLVESLVPGDVVRLTLGDRVPADIRLIDVKDLKVEMSSMTGEPDAIACYVLKQAESPLECRNIIFNSALVMNGEGFGVVIRTGDRTMIGRIAHLATATTANRSNMELEVLHFVHRVTVIAAITSSTFFTVGAIRAHYTAEAQGENEASGIINAFINGFILVLVAFVPEGLPATVASALTIASQRMAKRHVFIKRPDIIEALGAATVIASDKTGTLTQNRMTVENMWVNGSTQHARATVNRVHGGSGAGLSVIDTALVMSMGRELSGHDAEGNTRVQATFRGKPGGGVKTPAGSEAQLAAAGLYTTFSSFRTFSAGTKAGPAGMLAHVSWERSSPYMRLVIMAGVCNRARFAYTESGEETAAPAPTGRAAPGPKPPPKVLGDASDAALLRFVDSTVPVDQLRQFAFPVIFELPFNSVTKISMAVVRDPGVHGPSPASHISLLKGAPEVILSKCTTYLRNDITLPIDDAFKKDFNAAYERFAFMGERVLGFAFKPFKGSANKDLYGVEPEKLPPKDEYVFLGLISLTDPPRDGVAEAVYKCRTASVRVTMVTGDHPLTAEAIARKVGIITLPTVREIAAIDGCHEDDVDLADERVGAVVRAGPSLRGLSQAQWDVILSKPECVFARTTPQQKLEIVENYQRLGHVVAATGDGVNDSPALKKANIGVAMGSAEASDVAREAGDIVLLDDNFASIVGAIEEGRTMFDNLKKSIAYTIAHTVPELFPIMLNLFFNLPLALPGLVLLSIDLLSEQGPAISFAYERAEDSIMLRPPRKLGKDRLVSFSVLFYSYAVMGIASSLVSMFAFFEVYMRAGIPVSYLWNIMASYPANGSNPASDPTFPTLYVCQNLDRDACGASSLPVCTGSSSVSCRVAYSPDDQWNIYTESVAAYYATIIANQFWHVVVCRTRFVSIFEHGLFSNPVAIQGGILALFVACFFVYVPGVQGPFFTNDLAAPLWAISLIFGAFAFSYTEFVKYKARTAPNSRVAKLLAW